MILNTEPEQRQSASEKNTGADCFVCGKKSLDDALKEMRCERERQKNLFRPHISAAKTLLNILLPCAFTAGIFCALYFLITRHRLAVSLSVAFGALMLYVVLRTRAWLIWCIRVYQAVAPAKVRLRCVFSPSCSEYAVEALRRYGVLRGLPRIIKRLRRCHPPNGGDDPLE